MKLVLVEWQDAQTFDEGAWVERADVVKKPVRPKIFRQVGWLVSFDKEQGAILCSAADHETISARDQIPYGMVRSIREFNPLKGGKLTYKAK